MFAKDLIGNGDHFLTESFAVEIRQKLFPVLFKKSPQYIVKEFAGVDRLEIKRGFVARFELHDPRHEKSKRAVAVGAQAAGAVNIFRPKAGADHGLQVRMCDLPVVRSKGRAVPFQFDRHPAHYGIRQTAMRPRLLDQSGDFVQGQPISRLREMIGSRRLPDKSGC